jgi:N-methylhydantoinase B
VRIETPGGGGYGLAADRDDTALAADLRNGKITEAFIVTEFGEQKLQAVLGMLRPPSQAAE